MGPTLLHLSFIKQQTATFVYHAIAILVPGRNMSFKYHIYAICANYLMHINGESTLIHMSHMKSRALAMLPGGMYAYNNTNDNGDNNGDKNVDNTY